MAKRKAEEVEAGSSNHANKVAKLTQEESQGDSIDQVDDINANISNNDTEHGVATTKSDGTPDETPPNSPPQDLPTDSKSITTTDTDPLPPKPKGKKKATPAQTTRPTATRKSTRHSKKEARPVRKRLNKILRAKIKSVLTFLDTTAPDRTTMTITKSHLIAALMRLRQDYEIEDPKWADITRDVGEAVVREFSGPMGTLRVKTDWVVLDLSVKTEIEKMIEVKVEGWGLEDVRFLEVELEILGKEMEEGAMWRVLEAVMVVVEEKRFGVCPVPAAEVF
ncbi:hypothetical protein AC579_6829 [Pseudocercospora musae]|uniref:Uncharacterized protein n=1 Tax=Pseudocercospora musae TaxID=113226 RepID=A0A139IQN3_9PEZI|nr:hypothetical protein AC579_6829 [Pseudocercospora musae]